VIWSRQPFSLAVAGTRREQRGVPRGRLVRDAGDTRGECLPLSDAFISAGFERVEREAIRLDTGCVLTAPRFARCAFFLRWGFVRLETRAKPASNSLPQSPTAKPTVLKLIESVRAFATDASEQGRRRRRAKRPYLAVHIGAPLRKTMTPTPKQKATPSLLTLKHTEKRSGSGHWQREVG
jgi:hypothetical protein